MIRKKQHSNAVHGINGFKTGGVMTPEAYFKWLGLNPMTQQDYVRALNRQFKPGVIRKMQEAIRRNDDTQLHKVLSQDYQLLRLVNCVQFHDLCVKARLYERMPIRLGANLLDFQVDDAGPTSFWRAGYRNCYVTSVTTYWQPATKWAKEIGECQVDFMDCNMKSFIEKFDHRVDAVILGSGWNHIFKGILDKAYVPPRGIFLDPENTDGRLLHFYGILDEAVVPAGNLILEYDSLPPFEVGLVANELDRVGIFPHWQLAMSLLPVNFQDRNSALIFFRKGIPPFVQKAFTALTQKGEIALGTVYFGESAQLFREFFKDGALVALWEYKWQSNEVQTKIEFFQKGRVGLKYKTSSVGGNAAQVMPLEQLSAEVEQMKTYLKDGEGKGEIIIIKKFPA